MEFDYSKLKGRMVEKGFTHSALARAAGMSITAMWSRMHNHTEFKQSQIVRIAKILMIAPSDYAQYFFCVKSSETKTMEGKK